MSLTDNIWTYMISHIIHQDSSLPGQTVYCVALHTFRLVWLNKRPLQVIKKGAYGILMIIYRSFDYIPILFLVI